MKRPVGRLDSVHPDTGLDQGRVHQAQTPIAPIRGGDVISVLISIERNSDRVELLAAPDNAIGKLQPQNREGSGARPPPCM